MDIYIVYSRIQVLYPKWKFLVKTSINKIALVMIIFCVLVNVPINLGRQVIKTTFRIESNATTTLETYGKKLKKNSCI